MSFFKEIGLSEYIAGPTTIFADNQGAISTASKIEPSERNKHYDVKVHFQRERVALGDIRFKYVESANNVADPCTKSVSGVKMKNFRDNISLF